MGQLVEHLCLLYVQFPNSEIWHTRVPNLTWSHFRALLPVDNQEARYWYMNEAAREDEMCVLWTET